MQTATLSQSSLDEIISIIERNQSKCSNLKQNISLSLSYENELARITTQFLYDLSYDLRTILAALDRSRSTNMSLSNQLQTAERTIEEKKFKIKQLEATIVDLQSALYETNRKNNELTVVNQNNQNYIEELLMKMKLNLDRRNLSFNNDDYISKNKSMISTTYEYDDCCNGNNSFTARYPSYNYKQLNFDYDLKDFNYNYNLNSRNSNNDNNSYCKSYRCDEKPLNYDYGKSVNDMNSYSNRDYTSVFSNKRTNDISNLNRSSNILYNNNSMDDSRNMQRNDNQFIKTAINNNPQEEKKEENVIRNNSSDAYNNFTSDIKTIMQQRYGSGLSDKKNEVPQQQQIIEEDNKVNNQQGPIENNQMKKDEIIQEANRGNKYNELTNDIKTLEMNKMQNKPQEIIESGDNNNNVNSNVNNAPVNNTNEQQINQSNNNIQNYNNNNNQENQQENKDKAYNNLKKDVKTLTQRSYDNQPRLQSSEINQNPEQIEANIQVSNLDSINPQFSSQPVNQPPKSVLKSNKPISTNNNIVISDNTNESQENIQAQPLNNNEQPKTLYKSKTVATPEIQSQTQELYSKYKSQRNKNEHQPILREENSAQDDKTLSTEKITRVQKIVMEAFKDEDTVAKLKEKLGEDFEEKLTKAEVNEEYLDQIENALYEINNPNPQRISKRLQIAQGVNQKKKSKDVARDQLYYKTQLKRAITDKQYYYKEYPRGWNSSKDYFVNNNTSDGKIEKSTMKITTMPK